MKLERKLLFALVVRRILYCRCLGALFRVLSNACECVCVYFAHTFAHFTLVDVVT